MLRIWFYGLLIALWQMAFSLKASGQEPQPVTHEQFLEEFSILVNALRDVHPALYQFRSKPALDSTMVVFEQGISSQMTVATFHLHVRKFLRQIGCGHLQAMPSVAWYQGFREDVKLIPFDVYAINNQIFVSQVFMADSNLQPGMQIVAINGQRASTILAEMRAIQTVDGFNTTLEVNRINRLFPTYHLFLYGKQDTFTISYLNRKGEILEVKLAAAQKRKARLQLKLDTSQYAILGRWPDVTLAQNKLNKDLAILKVKTFNSKKYKTWQKEVFEQLQERNISHLVLDLRGNGGGYFPNGNRLLRYFLEDDFSMDFYRPKAKPERSPHLKLGITSTLTKMAFNAMPDKDKADTNRNYSLNYKPIRKHGYRGKIYVLTDGGTFSMASLVAAKLKHSAQAQVVGQESGGGEAGSNGNLFYWLTLPYSQIRVRIPYYHLDHKVPVAQAGRGIIPDEPYTPTLAELLKGEDGTLQLVERMVNQKY